MNYTQSLSLYIAVKILFHTEKERDYRSKSIAERKRERTLIFRKRYEVNRNVYYYRCVTHISIYPLHTNCFQHRPLYYELTKLIMTRENTRNRIFKAAHPRQLS